MTDDTFVFDTYALIEILNKNPNYQEYINSNVIINNFIFTEFCYNLIKDGVTNLDDYLNEVKPFIIDSSLEVIKQAMIFRYKHKKRKLSMTDCISYMMAKTFGVKFLTGDKEFENFENVEFVK